MGFCSAAKQGNRENGLVIKYYASGNNGKEIMKIEIEESADGE